MQHVLICGTSTRAAAESAARAGFRVTTIDAFADLDQHPSVRALSAARDFSAAPTASAIARAASSLDRDAVVYLSPFENHPRAVTALTAGSAVWGNSPETLRRVRDPFVLASTLRQSRLRRSASVFRTIRTTFERFERLERFELLKAVPFRRRQSNSPLARRAPFHGRRICQERIDGTPGSLVFAAAHGRCVPHRVLATACW